jgi:peroxiredoxin
MKRIGIPVGTLVAILALTSVAMGRQEEKRQAEPPARAEGPAVQRQAVDRGRAAERLQQQMSELRARYQNLIDQLKAIRATALKERAAETAGQIETLISKQQETYQKELRPLEQELQRLQRPTRERPGRAEADATRGRKAPDFELDSFDGRTFRLAEQKGRIVVLEWLNTVCPYVQYHYDKAKTMVELAKKYKGKNVVWVAINSTSDTTVEANREFAKKYKLSYPILDDRSGTIGRLYGARATPQMFVIDREGYIVYDGAIDDAPLGKEQTGGGKTNYVDKAITELLAGQKVSMPNTPPYGCAIKYAGR